MGQATPQLRPASSKLGRYELITMIGKGGMAEVHLAVQRGPAGFEKLVVVKLVHDHLATQRAFVDMLLDEGRLAGMIKHPNVVDIYDLGQADGRYYVAMEYLDGEPLLAVLRAGADGNRLDPLSTARVIADTAEGLEAAHRLKSRDGKPLGLVHHDVSLGNIVVLYTGVVKLVDFGVAKARSADKQDRIQGKFSYMAPEKLTEGAEVDRKSDIWSLGVVAWEALTLQRLFKTATGSADADTVHQVLEAEILPPSQVCGDIPKDFDPIIMRALERDPAKRYSTAKSFALDLEEVLRKRGYSGKNERISQYMERTFAKQIAAREQLLQDLSEGKPAETLEASIVAFRESATHTSTGDGRPIARPSEQVFDDPPPRRNDPTWSAARNAAGIKNLQSWVDERRRAKPWYRTPAAYAGAAALVLLLIILAARGGDDDRPPAPTPVPAATPPSPRPLTVAPDAGVAITIDAAIAVVEPDAAPIEPVVPDEEIAMDPVTKRPRPKPPKPPAPPAPKAKSADVLYAQGLDAFRKGDPKAALAMFTDARRADPSFAPAWYGLGLVHEALGNKGAAKSAYLRYLSLAPRAANAQQIRDRINRL